MKRILLSALAITIIAAAIIMLQRQRSSSGDKASANSETKENGRSERSDLNKTPLKLPLVEPKIIVSKSARRLTLYARGEAVRIYRVGLGSNPKDNKTRQGDGCTPEGSFYVCVKNPNSSYYLSLGLSYPNKEHAERGLRGRLITRAQYDRIINALEARSRPPWDTPLGGEVFIHGHGSKSDWTIGCVALENDDMKELFDVIPKGAPVIIEP
jgi:murein L,D-transpeptidase YafK